jgi:F420-dependent oxidoreductase-like protein
MRFSYWANAAQPWADVLDTALHVESTGWDGIWFADHFMPPDTTDDTGPNHECWTMLAALAAAVPRVTIGPLVTGNTYRHPAVLAKMAATVDHVSRGRLVLGLGAGWQENEHVAYGIEYSTVKGRLDRLEEACELITALFAAEHTTFAGTHYMLTDAPLSPKPVQDPLPLLIGGGGEQRTMRIAARFAHQWNVWGTPERLGQKSGVLDERCEEIDRDPAQIQRSTQALLFLSDDESWLRSWRDRDVGRPTIVGTPAEVVEIVAAYREAGADELIIPDWNLPDLARRKSVLDQFMTEVAPAFR